MILFVYQIFHFYLNTTCPWIRCSVFRSHSGEKFSFSFPASSTLAAAAVGATTCGCSIDPVACWLDVDSQSPVGSLCCLPPVQHVQNYSPFPLVTATVQYESFPIQIKSLPMIKNREGREKTNKLR